MMSEPPYVLSLNNTVSRPPIFKLKFHNRPNLGRLPTLPSETRSEERRVEHLPIKERHRNVVEGRQVYTGLKEKHIPVVNMS